MFTNQHVQTQNKLSAAVFQHYTEKQEDRNKAQAKDGYIHHHFGLGPTAIDPNETDQEVIIDEVQRQENQLTEHLLDLLDVELYEAPYAVDLGCGRGGNLFTLLDRYPHACADGINLTVYQANFCNEQIALRGLEERSEVRQANFLSIPYPDESFTHAYCCEVTQYALDLGDLFKEVDRVLVKGGRFVIATWCYDDRFAEDELRELIEPINDHYASTMHSLNTYKAKLAEQGLTLILEQDHTESLLPYWELRTRWNMASGIEDHFIQGHKERKLLYYFLVVEK